jgi:hypothetical protein
VHDFRQMINFDELTSDDTVTLARTPPRPSGG